MGILREIVGREGGLGRNGEGIWGKRGHGSVLKVIWILWRRWGWLFLPLLPVKLEHFQCRKPGRFWITIAARRRAAGAGHEDNGARWSDGLGYVNRRVSIDDL